MSDNSYTQILYETPAPGVARIVLNRPEKRNAQGSVMTYELDAAITRACHAEDVNVIILAAAGDHFSAGHDLSGAEPAMPSVAQSRFLWGDYGGPGWEGHYARERETYLDMTERWRNAPKPMIAEVQGTVTSGGNMLVWACDLIICADDARFRDNTTDMGICGAEFFAHPFELGVRKAKEWLFTTDWMTAQEAERRGMVNHVTPRAELSAFTLELAVKIASKNRFALKMIKEAVNACEDAMGRREGMRAAFHLHQICHMQNMLVHDFPIDISRLAPTVRDRLMAMKAAASA